MKDAIFIESHYTIARTASTFEALLTLWIHPCSVVISIVAVDALDVVGPAGKGLDGLDFYFFVAVSNITTQPLNKHNRPWNAKCPINPNHCLSLKYNHCT